MKIKCIVVDDEYLARVLLTDYIKKIPQLELVATCVSAPEAMEILQTETIELMFLDIQMPELTGIEFIKLLKNRPIVVFTTAYPEYALDGYALDITDYLLKPISFERFTQAVNKSIDQINLLKVNAKTDSKTLTKPETKSYISLKSEHRIYKVHYSNILYIEGLKEYVSFYLNEGKRIITLESMKNLELLLPDQFIRIHKSYIINKDFVKSLYGNMVEIGDKKIGIGKTYKDKVIPKLF